MNEDTWWKVQCIVFTVCVNISSIIFVILWNIKFVSILLSVSAIQGVYQLTVLVPVELVQGEACHGHESDIYRYVLGHHGYYSLAARYICSLCYISPEDHKQLIYQLTTIIITTATMARMKENTHNKILNQYTTKISQKQYNERFFQHLFYLINFKSL